MCGPARGVLSTRSTSLPLGYGRCHTGCALLKMTVQRAASGIIQMLYVPAANACPLTRTSLLNVTLVAVSAPGVHGRPQGTRAPNSSRPRALGRLYFTSIRVAPNAWVTEACWLRRG